MKQPEKLVVIYLIPIWSSDDEAIAVISSLNLLPSELIKTVDSANFIANNIKPEDVQNALTRDYSGLMKAISKKKTGEDNFRP